MFEGDVLLQATLQSIGDAVITTDIEGTVEYLNPMAEKLTGWSPDEARGKPLGAVFHVVNEQTNDYASDATTECLKKGANVELADRTILVSRSGREYGIQGTAAPIRVENGEVLGVVLAFSDNSEGRRMTVQMANHASHDSLTGLMNRRAFERRLQRALETARESRTEHALCYLDLDQFKVINDTCGHVAGDELLHQLGKLLRARMGKQDTLARLGGDEFGVLMERCSLAQARRVANGLRRAIADFQFLWASKPFSIAVSIGLVPITESSGTVTRLLSAADGACYVAKDRGRNRIHVYHKDDEALAKRHGEMQWATHVQNALKEDRFRLSFQPIAAIRDQADGRSLFELLLRMEGETGRLVSPRRFLPAVERYNLATRLDQWVVSNALEWLANHPNDLDPLYLISVNLSGHSLADGAFLAFVIRKLDGSGVPPTKLCFEITETAAIANLANATRFIQALQSRGCRFALDDFGTGLSSFAYLKQLPVDFIKIDGVFVRDIVHDPTSLAIVKSINEIGHVMGKQTIAEFVENEAILGKLRVIGVDYAQGYVIGRPRPIKRTR